MQTSTWYVISVKISTVLLHNLYFLRVYRSMVYIICNMVSDMEIWCESSVKTRSHCERMLFLMIVIKSIIFLSMGNWTFESRWSCTIIENGHTSKFLSHLLSTNRIYFSFYFSSVIFIHLFICFGLAALKFIVFHPHLT